MPDNATLERHFNEVALTPHEDRAVEALNLVTDTVVERVALVGTDIRSEPRSGRKVLAKVRGQMSECLYEVLAMARSALFISPRSGRQQRRLPPH